MLILHKGAKSLQLMLNEGLDKLKIQLVSKSAYSQARQHLSHTAFIELNQKSVVEVCYGDDQYQRYWGFRVVAIDGSRIVLPNNDNIKAEFGQVTRKAGKKGSACYSYALASVLYDVLNDIAIDSLLGDSHAYEVDLAEQHLEQTQANDLLLCDRNYPSYRWLATLVQQQRHFVIRCSASSFAPVRAMFQAEGPDSQIVILKPHRTKRADIQERGLLPQITVRLVRLVLADGQIEILITNLLDEQRYPTAEFGPLYYLRWGIETFFGRLKTRLGLENFSGLSPAAIKQDFFAAVFITGLESMLTDTAQERLHLKSTQTHQIYQVNHAVSFNAIKNHILDLFVFETDPDQLLEKLTALFMTDPTCIRPDRVVPRLPQFHYRRLIFHRRQKKVCF